MRDCCEEERFLDFELHKRISEGMRERLQAPQKKLLISALGEKLQPVVGLASFTQQKFDTPQPD